MEVSVIEFGSTAYKECIHLRNQILRIPLGMNLYEEDLSHEDADIHFAAIENGKLIGCLVLSQKINNTTKMRQVAVASEAQNKGVGKAMVSYSEQWAKANGFHMMELHARKTAIPFYEVQGYLTVGELFFEVGIPHLKMIKKLKI